MDRKRELEIKENIGIEMERERKIEGGRVSIGYHLDTIHDVLGSSFR